MANTAAAVPTVGLTTASMRLTYPARFKSEKAAERFIEDNGLWSAGVSIINVTGGACPWRIVIDSHRCNMLRPWLAQRFPGVNWTLSETPAT